MFNSPQWGIGAGNSTVFASTLLMISDDDTLQTVQINSSLTSCESLVRASFDVSTPADRPYVTFLFDPDGLVDSSVYLGEVTFYDTENSDTTCQGTGK